MKKIKREIGSGSVWLFSPRFKSWAIIKKFQIDPLLSVLRLLFQFYFSFTVFLQLEKFDGGTY